MRAWMSVGGDPRAISLIGVPIDKALMVVRDEHLPLRARQFARALLAYAGSVEGDLMTALAICVGACVDRIGEDMIEGTALLQGIAVCGHCGRKLRTHY